MGFLNRRRSNDNPNVLVGIFLLILLSVFMGPNILPRIISTISPIIDEAIPCDWLRRGFDRADHQSLIGRASTDAIGLEVRISGVPSGPNGSLDLEIVVINRSLGTVAFLYNPSQVNIGDDGTSGLGVIFDPGNLMARSSGRSDTQTYPEENIRLLGPRQRCIHSLSIPAGQLDPNVAAGNASVRAFYRINGAGAVVQAVAGPTPIYPDQGLAVVPGGFAQSLTVPVQLAVAS